MSVPVNGRPIIRVGDPLMAFAHVVQHLRGGPRLTSRGISPAAHIHPTARLGANVSVGPGVVIGEGCEIGANSTLHAGAIVGHNCRLGDDVTLAPHAVLYDDCIIGNRVTIHANAVIGGDGFGYRTNDGKHTKVPQLGWVEIEDDVEVGAGSTIDRGTFGATRIGMGTKIDNLVMIGHNCQIGRYNLLCSQVGIAGSSTTGEYVVMAGQVGVADHVNIGDRVMILAKSGVPHDIPANTQVLGYPSRPHKEQARIIKTMEKLPEIRLDLKRIKRHLGLEES
jgi:UDP-3-O-[3-hydroxymyristoyl] glucosamine N-acyltransferase